MTTLINEKPTVYGLDPALGIDTNPKAFKAFKKPIPLSFEHATHDQQVQTLENKVSCVAGDVIMTGTEGERWPIKKEVFESTYDVLSEGLASKKKIIVFALQIHEVFQAKLAWAPDFLTGQPGDYLVQYGENDFGIVNQEIFLKTYQRYEP